MNSVEERLMKLQTRHLLPAMVVLSICYAGSGKATADEPAGLSLSVGDKNVTIKVVQDGHQVKAEPGNVFSLEPKPFTLSFRGNVSSVSLVSLSKEELLAPLRTNQKPVAVFSGTSQGWSGFYTSREPLETYVATESFFTETWGSKPEFAAEAATHLKAQLGEAPFVITPCRYYLSSRSRRLTKEETVCDVIIDKIDRRDIEAGRRIYTVIFLEQPVGYTFSHVVWRALVLDFSARPAK